MRRAILLFTLLLPSLVWGQQRFVRFVFISDCHYGIEREFRGEKNVRSTEVNRAMIEKINSLPDIDFVVNGGDIANRAERGIQRSGRSWRQFRRDFRHLGVPMLLLPGNHDISNAIGHTGIPSRKVDPTVAVNIYNSMVKPDTLVSRRTYDHFRHPSNYSFDAGSGVLLLMVDMWPGAQNREWLNEQLDAIPENGVCLLFAHDQPDIETKHLLGYEDLVNERPGRQHAELAEFMDEHPAIDAYFHGNENYDESYTRAGVPVFRVDSPMKGVESSGDEKLLSFQLVTIDTREHTMTVDECFWNTPGGIDRGRSTKIGLR